MDLRFSTPELRKLDLLGTEIIVSTIASDERPPHGVTGLLDFRLAGRISRLIQAGFATGKVGEVLLIPGKPKLPFDKILLFGIGKRSEFNDPVFRTVLNKI
ncbi:MAG TPA: M17 family peptidase N-terminal domain-containing protein, partial [Polyangiaceae bacterium]|nr:M17 family peptidase N-terminal domain-containing protein [Polyangiaceae bacterium]